MTIKKVLTSAIIIVILHVITRQMPVVDWLRSNENNISKAYREFEIDRKRVREWDQKYDVLVANNRGQNAKRRQIGCDRSALSSDLDLKSVRNSRNREGRRWYCIEWLLDRKVDTNSPGA